jgi:hypothetical protein
MILLKIQLFKNKVRGSFTPVLFLLIISLSSCSGKKTISDPNEFMKWMNDPENGLVQTKYVSNVKINVKNLPSAYMAYLEMKNLQGQSEQKRDSLIAYYSQSKTFLLTISPDERVKGNSGDIMYRDVTGFEEYKDRSHVMNFEFGDYIDLITDNEKYKPVLSNLENVYGLSSGRKIILVFAEKNGSQDLSKSKELDLVFTDEIFNTGINHFVFAQHKLNSVPDFVF